MYARFLKLVLKEVTWVEKIKKGRPCCKGCCTKPPVKPPGSDSPPSQCKTLPPFKFLTWESPPGKHPLKNPISSEFICSPPPNYVPQIREPLSSEPLGSPSPSSLPSSKSLATFSEAPKSESQPSESNEPTPSEHFIGPVGGVPPSSEELTSTPSPSKKSSFDDALPIFPLSSNSLSGEILPSTSPLPDRPQLSERVVSNCMPSKYQTTSEPYDDVTSLSSYDTPTCASERVVSKCIPSKHQTTSDPYDDTTSLSPYDTSTCDSERVVSNCMPFKHQTTSEPYDAATSLSPYDIPTCDSERVFATNMPSKLYDDATPLSPYDIPNCEPCLSKQRIYDPADPSGEQVFDLPSTTPLLNALPVNESQAASNISDSAQKTDKFLTPKIQTRSHTIFTAPPSVVPKSSAYQSIHPFTSSKNSNPPCEFTRKDLPNSEASDCGLQSQDITSKEKKNNTTFPTQNPHQFQQKNQVFSRITEVSNESKISNADSVCAHDSPESQLTEPETTRTSTSEPQRFSYSQSGPSYCKFGYPVCQPPPVTAICAVCGCPPPRDPSDSSSEPSTPCTAESAQNSPENVLFKAHPPTPETLQQSESNLPPDALLPKPFNPHYDACYGTSSEGQPCQLCEQYRLHQQFRQCQPPAQIPCQAIYAACSSPPPSGQQPPSGSQPSMPWPPGQPPCQPPEYNPCDALYAACSTPPPSKEQPPSDSQPSMSWPPGQPPCESAGSCPPPDNDARESLCSACSCPPPCGPKPPCGPPPIGPCQPPCGPCGPIGPCPICPPCGTCRPCYPCGPCGPCCPCPCRPCGPCRYPCCWPCQPCPCVPPQCLPPGSCPCPPCGSCTEPPCPGSSCMGRRRICPPPCCFGGPIHANPCCPVYNKPNHKIYKFISILLLPLILLLSLNALGQEPCPKGPCREFEYMRRRNKRFPWGDGNKTFFHNDHVNNLPEECEPPPLLCIPMPDPCD